jgi:hypothetical protein
MPVGGNRLRPPMPEGENRLRSPMPEGDVYLSFNNH